MPLVVQKQGCGFCLSLHDTYEAAYQCETLGPPPFLRRPQGSTILFENEEAILGTRYSYLTMQGTVLYSFIGEASGVHVWIHILDTENFEALVLPKQFNTFCCSAHHKYPKGYAGSLRSYHRNFNLLYSTHY